MGGLTNRSAYVENANTTITGEGITIRVKGYWPNPSWELETTEKKIQNGILHLWVIGRSQPGMAIQVLHPFEYEITIEKGILGQIYQKKIVIYSRDEKEHVLRIQ